MNAIRDKLAVECPLGNNRSVGARLSMIPFIFALLALSLLFRLCFLNFESSDYRAFLSPWYDFITSHGRFFALRDDFSDYPLLYLYLLTIATLLPLKKLYAIKLISLVFDYAAAWYVYKIVKLKHGGIGIAVSAGLLILFLPTVVLNGAAWGQCDVIYTTALLACVYWLLRDRPAWAMAWYGLAICFKPQALFLGPFLYGMVLNQRIPFRSVAVPFLIWVAAALPAVLVGKPLQAVLYNQIGKAFGVTAGGGPQQLSFGAPNLYSWVPEAYYGVLHPIGCCLTLGAVGVLLVSMYVWRLERRSKGAQDGSYADVNKSKATLHAKMNGDLIVTSALLSLLIVPYLLPGMHERYFFAAELASIVYAFWFRDFWPVPLLIQCASLFSYAPFLFKWVVVPPVISSICMTVAITIVTVHYIANLRRWRQAPINSKGFL